MMIAIVKVDTKMRMRFLLMGFEKTSATKFLVTVFI